jgi:hypothetical protein
MASEAQTFGGRGGEFEVDATQRIHTLLVLGGWKIRNVGKKDFWVNFDAAAVATVDGNNPSNVPVPSNGGEVNVPDDVRGFSAKASSSAFGTLERREG